MNHQASEDDAIGFPQGSMGQDLMQKKTTVQVQIERMVKRIVKKFHPEQIILFGSQARGEAGPDSDIDLLIVMGFEGSVREKRLQIRQTINKGPVPVDVVLTRPEDFAWRKEVVGTIEWPAAREGKVLYAHDRGPSRGGPRSRS
jgi:predicted nucleotidyltransferase